MRLGLIAIAIAILVAAYWIASTFRYEYWPNSMRMDRWTGKQQINCLGAGIGWVELDQCRAAVQLLRQSEIPPDEVNLDK